MLTIFDRNNEGQIIESALTIFRFYGGELDLKNVENSNPVAVLISGSETDDLLVAALVADVAHNKGNKFTLLLPYLPAARADRGNPFGAKIYSQFINAIKADKVVSIDPHSSVMPKLVKNFVELPIQPVIKKYVTEHGTKYAGVIAPDKGAITRATKIANILKVPIIKAEKHRDFDTGILSNTDFKCETLPDDNGIYLVIDDICDGGFSFLGLAKVTGLPKEQLHLFVAHGVFSHRVPQLLPFYEKIITTNSHPGYDNSEINATIIDITTLLIKTIL